MLEEVEAHKDEKVLLAQPKPSRELSLSPNMLYAVGAGLLVVCGFVFTLGYIVGHHFGGQAASSEDQQIFSRPTSGAPKPPATQKTGQVKPPVPVDTPNTANTPPSAITPDRNTAAKTIETSPTTPTETFTIQVAAVVHQEDADTLVDTLKKHGYSPTAHHSTDDGLFHVKIGPFSSRSSANAMSQKLAHDGYNAIVE